MRTKKAAALAVGDTICRDEYTAVILRGPYPSADMFGRKMLGFWLKITSGPDRLGEEGEHMFGPDGLAVILSVRTPKSDARNEVIQKFTEAILALGAYADRFPYRERQGQLEALEELRDMFERSTAPNEDP